MAMFVGLLIGVVLYVAGRSTRLASFTSSK
jgi:hypothetical protein